MISMSIYEIILYAIVANLQKTEIEKSTKWLQKWLLWTNNRHYQHKYLHDLPEDLILQKCMRSNVLFI